MLTTEFISESIASLETIRNSNIPNVEEAIRNRNIPGLAQALSVLSANVSLAAGLLYGKVAYEMSKMEEEIAKGVQPPQ